MRNKVIDLLKDNEVTPEQKFNLALSYYRSAPHPNAGLIRGYNVKGYSPQRLEELLYDVKKAFNITDRDLGGKTEKVVPEKPNTSAKVTVPSEMPSFSKGAKGNAERKALVAELGLTAKSNKNVDLEAAIQNAIDTEAAKNIQMNVLIGSDRQPALFELKDGTEVSLGDVVAAAQEASGLSVEEWNKKAEEGDETEELIQKYVDTLDLKVEDSEEEKQQKAETEAFNKVVSVLEAGEVCPPSFVREAFDNKDMTDDQANEIIEKAKATLPEPPKGTISKEEALAQAEKAKQAKADTKKK